MNLGTEGRNGKSAWTINQAPKSLLSRVWKLKKNAMETQYKETKKKELSFWRQLKTNQVKYRQKPQVGHKEQRTYTFFTQFFLFLPLELSQRFRVQKRSKSALVLLKFCSFGNEILGRFVEVLNIKNSKWWSFIVIESLLRTFINTHTFFQLCKILMMKFLQ